MSDQPDHQAIVDVLNRYSYALDTRDWPMLEDVFHPDATGDYGGFQADGRATLIQTISGYLDPCGPSQHLLGNYHVTVEGDEAVSSCYIRVIHMGEVSAPGYSPTSPSGPITIACGAPPMAGGSCTGDSTSGSKPAILLFWARHESPERFNGTA